MPADQSMQSVQRTVQILYAIAGVEDGCTIQQIAARANLKPNTAYKFTRTLEREHLIVRKEHPLRFVLGPAIAELKSLDDNRHLLSVAGKLMIRIQAKLPIMTLSLLEVQRGMSYQRLCVQSNRPGVLIQRREFKVSLYDKASSLLFLALCHPDEAQAFYDAHPFEEEGKALWKSRARLDEFLGKVRRLGYCLPEVPDHEGPHYRVAAPIFSRGQEMIAAFGAFIMSDDPKECRPRLLKLCQKAAEELTENLQ